MTPKCDDTTCKESIKEKRIQGRKPRVSGWLCPSSQGEGTNFQLLVGKLRSWGRSVSSSAQRGRGEAGGEGAVLGTRLPSFTESRRERSGLRRGHAQPYHTELALLHSG